jgi:hypothetical protein
LKNEVTAAHQRVRRHFLTLTCHQSRRRDSSAAFANGFFQASSSMTIRLLAEKRLCCGVCTAAAWPGKSSNCANTSKSLAKRDIASLDAASSEVRFRNVSRRHRARSVP